MPYHVGSRPSRGQLIYVVLAKAASHDALAASSFRYLINARG
jgi:hypothetical protein